MSSIDVIIVGGGPAGCATALSLLKSNPDATFLVIDDTNPSAYKIGESLPPEAIKILQYLSPSLPDQLSQTGHLKCTGNASIWESPEVRESFGMMNPFGYGLHLDRAAFDEMLRKTLVEARPKGIIKGKFTSISKADGLWEIKVDGAKPDGAEVYRSKWVVDATGRKASVGQKVHAKTIKSDDVLSFYAVFASDSTAPDNDHRTLIEASPPGWFYSSQLPNRRRLVAFHTSGSSSAAKLARRLPGFLDLLAENSTLIRETIEQNGYSVEMGDDTWPKATAAGSSYLSPFGSEEDRWCAVGDAAMAFDPLSSQGMITSLKCGCSVGIMLAKDIGKVEPRTFDFTALVKQYETIRKDYEDKRSWFYKQAMFDDDEFWKKQK
ncbi:hypothetical protein FRC04_000868 [Tulasnella sp. 424]|nr:hypothetical protein FRC04_000868 [Tulasnella sp. 424]KAG8975396.1 hypothetical protein FRC05_005726 [Tulasnella sp. 425]